MWLMLAGCVTDAELRRALDRDQDGYLPTVAGGPDCDESRADIHPGATEVCGDQVDNDCDGIIDDAGIGNRVFFLDADSDGFGTDDTLEACTLPPGYAEQPGDCDDLAPARNPAAQDLCDGIDQDCDGLVDDDALFRELYQDLDGDGAGNPGVTTQDCGTLPGFVDTAGDCDDTNEAVRPGVEDNCNGVDDDCDGQIDDDAFFVFGYVDHDRDGVGDPTTGTITCALADLVPVAGDCDDQDPNVRPGLVDDCDGRDTNCDGTIDDAATSVLTYADADGDGAGDPLTAEIRCDLSGRVENGDDCDDDDASFAPNQTDTCDGQDQDCDGLVDDDAPTDVWYPDLDGDGFGDPAFATRTCGGPPAGFIALGGDCDDADVSTQIPVWYPDLDGDGFGAGNGIPGCAAPVNHVLDHTDCDDTQSARNPGEDEVCENNVDDDCDDRTLCRFEGVVSLPNDLPPRSTTSPLRPRSVGVGNAVGGPEDDHVIDAHLYEGGSPFSAPVFIDGLMAEPGVDLDGDGLVELFTEHGEIVQGGSLVVSSRVLESVGPVGLIDTGAMSGLVFAHSTSVYILPFGVGDVSVADLEPLLVNCLGGRRAVNTDGNFVFTASNGIAWADLGALAGPPVDCTTLPRHPTDVAHLQPDFAADGALVLTLDLPVSDVLIRAWQTFADFESGAAPYSEITGSGFQHHAAGPVGDIDGDGLLDFVSVPNDSDAVYAVLSYGTVGPVDLDEETSRIVWNDDLGFSHVWGVGDVDGDGYDDLLFGANATSLPLRFEYGSGI